MNNPITIKENHALRERYYKIIHPSGLEIFVIPKELSNYYALFGTRYGAIDNCFRTNDNEPFTRVPDGIAHFLEHKLFENEDGTETDTRFSSIGASANAFTSADMTAYEFTCTENFYEALEILLDFVTHPYFTKETVQKEQGIIGQEIAMCDDMPTRRLYYEILQALYHHDNTRINVCGTQGSIAQITPEHLYACYRTFYHPTNMTLVLCGKIDPQKVCAIADTYLPNAPAPQEIDRYFEAEPDSVLKKRHTIHMDIARPMFAIGIKDVHAHAGTAEGVKRDYTLRIVSDLLFGTSSYFYEKAYDDGLLNARFSAGYEAYRTCAFFLLSGETDDPEEIYNRVLSTIRQAKQTPPAIEDFLRIKKALYAEFIRDFDSTEEIANNLLSLHFSGVDLLDTGDLINSITYQETVDAINDLFCEDFFSMATILPESASA